MYYSFKLSISWVYSITVAVRSRSKKHIFEEGIKLETITVEFQAKLIYSGFGGEDWPSSGHLIKASFHFLFNEITQSFY